MDTRTYYAPWLSSLDWHLDFVIDGVSVPDRILALEFPEGYGFSSFEESSVANPIWADTAIPALTGLTLAAPRCSDADGLGPGRFLLYVCPLCGDLGCGAITIGVSRGQDRQRSTEVVHWSDLRCEYGYREPLYLAGFGEFRFDAAQYDAAIAEAVDTLGAIAEAERLAEAAWQPVRGRLRLAWQRLRG